MRMAAWLSPLLAFSLVQLCSRTDPSLLLLERARVDDASQEPATGVSGFQCFLGV